MAQTREYRYHVGCGGSGWGVWDMTTNRKIKSFTSRSVGRFEALRYLYYLNGWDWLKSKYVKEDPSLAYLEKHMIY